MRARRWTAAAIPDLSGRTAVVTGANARSHDVADQARLWQVSEELTGVCYDIKAPPALT